MKPRVVFDCVVFLQGAARPTSPARACFELLDQGAAELCLSAEVLAEVRDVLTRPTMQKGFPLLTVEGSEAFLRNAESKAMMLASVPPVFSYPRDPKDEKYVNLAVVSGARYLVTRDNALLDLMDESRPEGKDFRQRFPNLVILGPVAFLHELRQQEPARQADSGPSQEPPTETS
ncbi:MAG: putative toxin-antitoxin system toxin component, PIN family [Gemmataceae bacterium]|nr:putative toxin-antitoxin system toxin component, PIN family [Gemmataceae bacterium]